MSPNSRNELIERLGRKEQRFPAKGGGSIGSDSNGKITTTSYVTDDGYRLVNPDGPEAAETISSLVEERDALRERVEQVISAWAFAHNIDGAARNDLFARLRSQAIEGVKL